MALDTVVRGSIISVTTYSMESNSGCTIFLSQENDGSNPNIIGNEIITVSASYDMKSAFEGFANSGILPGMFDLVVSMGRGAAGKAKVTCKSVKPVVEPKPVAKV